MSAAGCLLTERLLATVKSPEFGSLDVGEAAVVLLSLSLLVAKLSPDPARTIAKLDAVWLEMSMRAVSP